MPKGDERTGEDEGQGDRGRDREGEAHDGLLRAKASVRWNDPPSPAAAPDCGSAVAQPGDALRPLHLPTSAETKRALPHPLPPPLYCGLVHPRATSVPTLWTRRRRGHHDPDTQTRQRPPEPDCRR